MEVKGQYDTALVTIWAMGIPRFPLSWTLDHNLHKAIDSRTLTLFEQEMIKILSCFRSLSSCTLITHDYEDGDGVHKYMGKIYGMIITFCPDLFISILYELKSFSLLFCREHDMDITLKEEIVFGSDVSHITAGVLAPPFVTTQF